MKENEEKKECKAHVCNHQIAFILDNPLRKILQSPKKLLSEYIKQGDIVMDLGCGPGFFTTDMALMVGSDGKVIAADLQKEMLEKVKKKAKRKNLEDRIEYHLCNEESIGFLDENSIDFILAYYMIHETPNPENTLKEIKKLLKPGGKLLTVEPKMHVDENKFKVMVESAQKVGYKILDYPPKKGGRSVVLTK